MLAQNFKTPADLGITDAEFDALYKVLGMLERGEIPHELCPSEVYPYENLEPRCFNLGSWRCGTTACIGGWAEYIGSVSFPTRKTNTGLDRLFYPDDYDDEIGMSVRKMRAVTPPQAAIALRSYLTHGEPRWAEALSA